jgi:hypothetical protein
LSAWSNAALKARRPILPQPLMATWTGAIVCSAAGVVVVVLLLLLLLLLISCFSLFRT